MEDKEQRKVYYLPDVLIIVIALSLSVASFALGYVAALHNVVIQLHK